ncbi:hypothetical protein VD0002_g9545 [Verticillium dahliae]|nr:hypothetical protein VD0002_g9545 [Verticillium dahliae]
MGNTNSSASDIITYIGVPLAVLGVLPILYNPLATLAALSRIRRMLRHSRLTALTRSDVVNRVIEVDLPRYAVTPWHRSMHRSAYWSLAPHPSTIPGGSWSVFNWNTNTIGIRTQRVEYADQLRQPQVEVAFEELICYLLDLGAVPNAHGWRLLRNTGLWTPVGCALMQSPDGTHKALTVAPLDNSDGHLSLAVSWSSHWTTRDHTSLPPYWVRLPAPSPEAQTLAPIENSTDTKDSQDIESQVDENHIPPSTPAPKKVSSRTIICKIASQGLIAAQHELDPESPPSSHSDPGPESPLDNLPIDHLRPATTAIWFASAATAYGTSARTLLWSHRIPETLLSFVRRASIPCGVLELISLVDPSATPEWGTLSADDSEARRVELMMRRMREQRGHMEKEARMSVAERQQAIKARMERENLQRLDDFRDKMHADLQRKEARLLEALQSPKWTPAQLAPHALRWLKENSAWGSIFSSVAVPEVPVSWSLKPVLGPLLHTIVLNDELSSRLVAALESWKAWSENGGMRRTDIDALMKDADGDKEAFALASLVAAGIGEATSGDGITGARAGDAVGADMQECLGMWPKIRLG